MVKKSFVFIFNILVSLGIGTLSALLAGMTAESYNALILPKFAPPAAVYPVVWTILYILMGIGAALITLSDSSEKVSALKTYAYQLVINFSWSIIFFRFELRLLAFFWILMLLMFLILMYTEFYNIKKIAAIIQIPYIIWVIIASILNFSIYLLNR